jgi:hypothetical protein
MLFAAAIITIVIADVFLMEFLNQQNNTVEVIHGTGKNKFLLLPDHSGRFRIPDLGLIVALKSAGKYNVTVHQLPDNDVISIPMLGSVIGQLPPEPPKMDEYCAHPFPVAAHPAFEKLNSSEVIEVLFPSGCSSSFWVYGSDAIINEYFPRPYFSLVSTTGQCSFLSFLIVPLFFLYIPRYYLT